MKNHITTRHKGRGALSNPDGRFESASHTRIHSDELPDPDPAPATTLTPDHAKSIISRNQSPDVPFELSINPYRGCEHGCVYCFARPSHEYLGLSCGIDFETRLFHKPAAPELLRRELAARSYDCKPIALGINTDAYQPSERKLGLTRALLEVMREHHQPVSIVTKSALIERDLDILSPMAALGLVQVTFSVTTLDHELARRMEPRATAPARRLRAVETLSGAGIPVGILVAPLIPALNEPELERILNACSEAGATSAGYVVLRLPHQVKALFQDWLACHYPLKATRVMKLVRSLHGAKDYNPAWGERMSGTGPFAKLLADRFQGQCRRLRLNQREVSLDCSRFAVPGEQSMQLKLC